jgi:hypothetical protein
VTACPLLSSHSLVVVLWIRGWWLCLYYYDDYCISFTFGVDFYQHSDSLCMFQFIGANIIHGLSKMAK